MSKSRKSIETLRHTTASRTNIPTAELESIMATEDKSPIQLSYARRNRDLDPQLVWRGKDEQDPATLHPGENPPQGLDRRSIAPEPLA